VTQSKSENSRKAEQCPVEADDDLLDLDLGPDAEATDEELIRALDSDGFVTPDPAPQDAEWLADFKALGRKHRPFSSDQVVEIVRVLFRANEPADEAGK
jgi:hypothetical protein